MNKAKSIVGTGFLLIFIIWSVAFCYPASAKENSTITKGSYAFTLSNFNIVTGTLEIVAGNIFLAVTDAQDTLDARMIRDVRNADGLFLIYELVTCDIGGMLHRGIKYLFEMERYAYEQICNKTLLDLSDDAQVIYSAYLSDQCVLEGTTTPYTLSFDMKVYKLGFHHYISFENIELVPYPIEDLPQFQYCIHRIMTDVRVYIESIPLPLLLVPYQEFVGTSIYYKLPSDFNDYISPSSSYSAVVDIYVDRWAVSAWRTKIGTFEMCEGSPSFPGLVRLNAPQNTTTVAGNSVVYLDWDDIQDADLDHYVIYRSTHLGIMPVQSNLIGEVSNSEYTDTEVQNGLTYRYVIAGVGQSGTVGVPTQEIVTHPTDELQIQVAITPQSSKPYTLTAVSGYVHDGQQNPVSGANVSIRIPDIQWSLPSVSTLGDGSFEALFFSPNDIGKHTVISTGTYNRVTVSSFNSLTVVRDLDEGHDVKITRMVLEPPYVKFGNTLSCSLYITNSGQYQENNIPINFTLLDPNNQFVSERNKTANLNTLDSTAIVATFNMPLSGVEGYYLVISSVNNAYDCFRTDNFGQYAFYSGNLRDATRFGLDTINFDSLGVSRSAGGHTITLTAVGSSSAEFFVSGEGTVTIELDELWASSGDDLLIIPTNINPPDGPAECDVGTENTQFNILPGELIEYVGHSAVYRITTPSGTILNSSVEIKYGADCQTVDSWSHYTVSGGTDNIRDLYIDIPLGVDTKAYEFWLTCTTTNSKKWMKRLYLRTIPIHDIKVEPLSITNTTFNNNPPLDLVGDVYKLDIPITNNGGYLERFTVGVEITKDDSIVFLFSREDTLGAGMNTTVHCTIPTLGLSAGSYSIYANAPLWSDENHGDNNQVTILSIQDPPLLVISLSTDSSSYSVGSHAVLSCQVTYNSAVMRNANVEARIEMPGYEDELLSLQWDPGAQAYVDTFQTWIGGNFRIPVTVTRNRFRTTYDTLVIPVRVEFDVDVASDEYIAGSRTYLGRNFTVPITISSVGDLHAFSGELQFDPLRVQCVSLQKAGFLEEDGNINTSLMYNIDNSSGKVALGLTRLSGGNPGALCPSGGIILYSKFKSHEEGKTSINLIQATALASDGITEFVSGSSPVDSTYIYSDTSAVSFSPCSTSMSVMDTTIVYVDISQVRYLHSVAFDITYDPQLLRVLSIHEDSCLNQNGQFSTLFQTHIDSVEGRIAVGITRTSSDLAGVTCGPPEHLMSMKIVGKESGSSALGITNLGLMPLDVSITYPGEVNTGFVNVTGWTDTTIIGFQPDYDTVYVDSVTGIDVTIRNVSDLFAVACDVMYNPNLLHVDSVTERNFLNSGGSVQTSFMVDVDSSAGRIIIGLSRLDSGIPGAQSATDTSLFTIKFKGKSPGRNELMLTNVGLLATDGITQFPFESETAYVRVRTTVSIPGLLQPNNSSIISDSLPTFVWSNVFGGKKSIIKPTSKYQLVNKQNPAQKLQSNHYILQYAEDSLFSQGIVTIDTISDTTYTLQNSLQDKTYYWRVEAVDSTGQHSGYQDFPFKFTVDTKILLSLKTLLQGYYNLYTHCSPPTIVTIELRDSLDPTNSVYTNPTFSLDSMGVYYNFDLKPLIQTGRYYVVVKKINHLAVISDSCYLFSHGSTNELNFAEEGEIAHGEDPMWLESDSIYSLRGGDINQDGVVFIPDYCKLVQNWATNDSFGDIDGDSVVFISDYNILAQNWARESFLPEYASKKSASNHTLSPLAEKEFIVRRNIESQRIDNEQVNTATKLLSVKQPEGLFYLRPYPDSTDFEYASGDTLKLDIVVSIFDTAYPFYSYSAGNFLSYDTTIFSLIGYEDYIADGELSQNWSDITDNGKIQYSRMKSATGGTDTGWVVADSTGKVIYRLLFVIKEGISEDTTDMTFSNTAIADSTWNTISTTTMDTTFYIIEVGTEEPDEQVLVPRIFELSHIFPNPAFRMITIKYAIPTPTHAVLKIYDLSGKLVRTLVDETDKPAYYSVTWDCKDSHGKKLPSGIYFIQFKAGNYKEVKKLILLR